MRVDQRQHPGLGHLAQLITAQIAENFGMAAAMASASLAFTIAAGLWLAQRETLARATG